MPQYVPILKGKAAEYWAWKRASPAVIDRSRPIFEVAPKKGLNQDLGAFVKDVAREWPHATVLTVDTGHLAQNQPIAGTSDRAVLWTAKALLDHGVAAKSVMRFSDDPLVLEEVAKVAALHGQGACLRLGSPGKDPVVGEAESSWPKVLRVTGLQSHEVDLLIDVGEVRTPGDVARCAAVVAPMLQWASGNGNWRSVTVASGAFPQSISDLPNGQVTAIHRYDADLFTLVVAQEPPIKPDYGDYGIWHPDLLGGSPRGPHPNLRYTHDREWQVYREPTVRPGNESFFTLCRTLVSSPHWPVSGQTYSAGDAQIARCAQEIRGAGTATYWLRWGASHHFEHVVDRLTTLGEP